MKQFKMRRDTGVVLSLVRKYVDKFAKTVKGNAIEYTLRESPEVLRHLDANEISRIFTDLYGDAQACHERSTNDLRSIKCSKSVPTASIAQLKKEYQVG